MPTPSRRLTTLWFADIAGFTRLSATDEPLALRVMEVMRNCVKAAVLAEHGKVIKYLGDGALAEFPSAEGAVAAALDAGARFMGGTRGCVDGPFRLHIGIHVGDVTVSEGDIFGDGVNRAARLQELGKPGEVLVSEEVFALVRRRPELKFTSLGERTAKGLDEPFLVYSVEPTGELAARLEQIEEGNIAAAGRAPLKVVPYPRAIGIGMATAVATFAGLAVWTAMGGTVEVEQRPVLVPAHLALPPHDEAFAMPAWPPAPLPRSVERTSAAIETAPAAAAAAAVRAPDAPPPNTLADLARRGERYMADFSARDIAGHEVLPLLRRALNEARDGGPKGGRAEAIRGIALFMVARDAGAAERAFHDAIASEPSYGLARLMYAKMLTAHERFGEARFQLEQAKGKGVSNGMLDAARGALFFREGEYGDARAALERSLKDDDVLATRILLARTLIAQKRTDDALRVLDKRIGSFEIVPWMAYARLRGERESGVARANLVEMAARQDAGYAGALALLEAGESNRALDAIERMARIKDPDLIWLGVDPEWTTLRGHERFGALANRVLGHR